MKDKIVLDTNIFIDAWFKEDLMALEMMHQVTERNVVLLFSQQTIGELVYITKNFSRHTFDEIYEQLEILSDLMEIFHYSYSINTLDADRSFTFKSDDPFDDMFVECAYHGNAKYIVTKDRKNGLLKLGEIEGIKIITPEQYIRSLQFK